MTKTLDVAYTSLRDVRRIAKALGATIVSEETTRGAVGYVTVTIAPKR